MEGNMNKRTKLSESEHTNRGFEIIKFTDYYKSLCSLQESSCYIYEDCAPGHSAVWLGVDEPRIFDKVTGEEIQLLNVSVDSRMHLNRDQVSMLIKHLNSWLESGTFDYENLRNE